MRRLKYSVSAHKMVSAILIILLFFFYTPAFCQSREITGSVKDRHGAPIANANVTLIDITGKISLYKLTDIKGNFAFKISDTARLKNIIQIQANAFGYTKQTASIEKAKNLYLFTLDISYQELEDVSVKGAQRVRKKGDTTSYNVGAFAGKEDRSIGDVISRIPGMSVAEDGTIKYKDKDVKGLYIHGDDLLGSNYGVGSNTIPKEMIKSIEVIERFQPIRVLKDKVGTNDVAINLVLKNENALNLTGQAGAGFGEPGLLDLNVTSMMFNKKIKFLAAGRYNNTGESFIQNSFSDLLTDAVVENPGIPDKYINRNKSLFTNGNFLYNLKDSAQIKTNIQYLADNKTLMYNAINSNYLENDTIVYTEEQRATKKPYHFSAAITLEQNKASRYLVDRLGISLGGMRSTGLLRFNDLGLQQDLSTDDRLVSNHLSWMPAFKGRNTYSIDWKLNYRIFPQNLFVSPGIDSAGLNNGNGYKSVIQNVRKEQFINEIIFNYFINDRKLINKSFSLGVANELQRLESSLILNQSDGSSNPYTGDQGNDLKWQRHKEYLNAGFFIKKQYLSAFLTVPLVFQQIRFTQPVYHLSRQNNSLFLNPSLLFNYFFNTKNVINLSYDLTNNFGSINNVYRGVILKNFKELSSNSSDIQEIRQNRVNVQYTFNNPVKLFEFSTGVTYMHKRANSIYSTEYRDNILYTVLLPYKASQSIISYQAAASKYISLVKSKFELSGSYTRAVTNQFANGSFLPYLNGNWNLRLTGGCNLFDHVSLYYTGSGNWISGWPKQELQGSTTKKDRITIYNHNYSIVITPKIPMNIILQARQQVNHFRGNSTTQYFFGDIDLRYNLGKIRTEFELEINNIFDTKEFGTYYLTANQLYSSRYQLRGRMLLLKANFRF